jgi:hypothetical protein
MVVHWSGHRRLSSNGCFNFDFVLAMFLYLPGSEWLRIDLVIWSFGFPGFYFTARLSLALPAAAIRQRFTLMRSWVATSGDGWRLTCVLTAFPAAGIILGWVIDLVVPSPQHLNFAVRFVIFVFVAVFEIAALSQSFQWYELKRKSASNL